MEVTLLEGVNSSVVGQIIGFVGVGAFVDMLLDKRTKRKLAGYIFGQTGLAGPEFFSITISSLLELLCKREDLGRLSLKKVYIYSLLSSILSIFFISFVEESFRYPKLSELGYFLAALAVIAALIAVLSFPFDLISVWLSKWFFYYQPHSMRKTVVLWCLDVSLSIAPVLIVSLSIFSLTDGLVRDAGPITTFVFIGASMAGMGVVTISLAQAIIIITGSISRGLFLLLQRKESSFESEAFVKAPVTYCFLVAAVLLSLMEAVVDAVHGLV